MSETEKKNTGISIKGEGHTPAPPKDAAAPKEGHTPAPPAKDGGVTTQGEGHTPAPPKD
ncbi:sigma-like protein [Actinomycetota bacterium Odt1-20B]